MYRYKASSGNQTRYYQVEASAIQKFNKYCKKLEALAAPGNPIPIPATLPEELVDLHDNSSLMEDVWMAPVDSNPVDHHWLNDKNVCTGIKAVLQCDRCLEERRWLGREADNLCWYFGRRLGSIEVTLRCPKCTSICTLFFSAQCC